MANDAILITFIVVTYRQEELVIQTLESIRHQAVTYGKGKGIQLIVCDDASPDHTLENVQDWCRRRGDVFAETLVLSGETNVGTSKNLAKSFPHIRGEYFKTIAGDDLLADVDLIGRLQGADLYVGSLLYMQNGRVLTDPALYQDHYLYFGLPYSRIRKLSKFRYLFCTQGWIIRTVLLTPEVQEAAVYCKLIEDQTMWIALTRQNPSLDLQYVNEPVVLYRTADDPLHQPISPQRMEENLKIILYRSRNAGLLAKWSGICLQHRIQGSAFWSYLDPYKYYSVLYRNLHRSKWKASLNTIFETYGSASETFFKEMTDLARQQMPHE